jgi:hypothetical protein
MGKIRRTRKKIRRTRKKIKKNTNAKDKSTYISVLTYNVCWECMSGTAAPTKAKAYGQKCGSTKPNRCRLNVIELCTSNPYSFITLQEATPDLADDIIKVLKKKGLGRYSKIYKKYGSSYAILIYDKVLFKISGKDTMGRSSDILEFGRPYIAQRFINKKSGKSIIVSSFHGPHSKKDWVEDYLYRVASLNKKSEQHPQILVMGDYNREVKKDFKLRLTCSKGRCINTTTIKVLNKGKIKTAYNLDGKEKYTKAIDNIMISDNIKVIFGPETVGDNQNVVMPQNTHKKYTNMTSDHRPLTALLSIN